MKYSSSILFHCVVCFEQFDSNDRFPVILPCGHTFVCSYCSMRLDACMECRRSLYHQVSLQKSYVKSTPIRSSSIMNRKLVEHNSPNEVKLKFPLPKNLVLIELMNIQLELGLEKNEDDNDSDEVITNLLIMASSSGTYVVTDRDGLELYEEKALDEEDIIQIYIERKDTKSNLLIAGFRQLPFHPTDIDNENKDSMLLFRILPFYQPAYIKFGSKVQVVSMKDGWAKLSKGKGFLRAENLQLVKVAAPSEQFFKAEAALDILLQRKLDLSLELKRVDDKTNMLKTEMKDKLKEDEEMRKTYCELKSEKLKKDITEDGPIESLQTSKRSCANSQENTVIGDSSVGSSSYLSQFFMRPIESILNKVLMTSSSMGRSIEVLPTTSREFLSNRTNKGCVYGQNVEPNSDSIMDDPLNQVSPISNPRQPPLMIDFRTGMSGHKALLSSRSTYSSPCRKSPPLRMSGHSALSPVSKGRSERTNHLIDLPIISREKISNLENVSLGNAIVNNCMIGENSIAEFICDNRNDEYDFHTLDERNDSHII